MNRYGNCLLWFGGVFKQQDLIGSSEVVVSAVKDYSFGSANSKKFLTILDRPEYLRMSTCLDGTCQACDSSDGVGCWRATSWQPSSSVAGLYARAPAYGQWQKKLVLSIHVACEHKLVNVMTEIKQVTNGALRLYWDSEELSEANANRNPAITLKRPSDWPAFVVSPITRTTKLRAVGTFFQAKIRVENKGGHVLQLEFTPTTSGNSVVDVSFLIFWMTNTVAKCEDHKACVSRMGASLRSNSWKQLKCLSGKGSVATTRQCIAWKQCLEDAPRTVFSHALRIKTLLQASGIVDMPDSQIRTAAASWPVGSAVAASNRQVQTTKWLDLTKAVVQSTCGGGAELAVDGNSNTDYYAGSCTRTCKTSNPFWRVHLPPGSEITKVRITSMHTSGSDGIDYLGSGFDVYTWTSAGYAACAANVKIPSAGTMDVPCEAKADALLLYMPRPSVRLTLCEVSVMVKQGSAGASMLAADVDSRGLGLSDASTCKRAACIVPASMDPEAWDCDCLDAAMATCQNNGYSHDIQNCLRALFCESSCVCASWKEKMCSDPKIKQMRLALQATSNGFIQATSNTSAMLSLRARPRAAHQVSTLDMGGVYKSCG